MGPVRFRQSAGGVHFEAGDGAKYLWVAAHLEGLARKGVDIPSGLPVRGVGCGLGVLARVRGC